MNKEIDNNSSFGDAKTGSSSPIDENVNPKKKERCFFGLLSLRSGVLVTCVGSFMLDLVNHCFLIPYNNSVPDEGDSVEKFGEPFFDNFNVTIPFTGGIQRQLFQISPACISPFGIYGAYYKSPRVMKYYKRMFLIESVCVNFQCLTNFAVALYNCHKRLSTAAITEAMDPEELAFDLTGLKIAYVGFTTLAILMIATDRYRIHLHNRYHRLLKEKEE